MSADRTLKDRRTLSALTASMVALTAVLVMLAVLLPNVAHAGNTFMLTVIIVAMLAILIVDGVFLGKLLSLRSAR